MTLTVSQQDVTLKRLRFYNKGIFLRSELYRCFSNLFKLRATSSTAHTYGLKCEWNPEDSVRSPTLYYYVRQVRERNTPSFTSQLGSCPGPNLVGATLFTRSRSPLPDHSALPSVLTTKNGRSLAPAYLPLSQT